MPVGADELRGGAAHRRRGLPRPQGRAQEAAASRTAVGDEGGFAPDLGSNEEAIQVIMEAIDAAGYEPGARRAASPSTRPPRASTRKGKYVLAGEGRSLTSAEMVDYYAALVDKYPIISHRGRPGRGRLGRLQAHDREARRPHADRRRRPLRHQHRAPRAGHRDGLAPTRILIKLNQIGTLSETLDAIEMAKRAGWTAVVLAPLGRDRGHDASPTSPWPPTPARSRPAPRRAPTASPSTTSCCASRRCSARWPTTRA